jgi:hypothetical protein
MKLVDFFDSPLEGNRSVWSMQVKNANFGKAKLGQGSFERCSELFGGVITSVVRIDSGIFIRFEGQTSLKLCLLTSCRW